MKLLLITFLLTIMIISVFNYQPINAEKIPVWIKNIFEWYSQDKVSEDEILNALKFLIEGNIIDIELDGSTDIWKPKPGTSWNWQLDTPIDATFDVNMYDIDLFDNKKTTIDLLHSKGAKVVCYISVGSWEEWRSDADQYPSEVLGNDYDEWPGEKWLDIRNLDVIAPIIENRLDICKEKGFDGVEPDNISVYNVNSGFPITYEDQIQFNIWLADKAHKRGLSIGLKNDLEQVNDLLPYFDWALVEECYTYDECIEFTPFIDANKAVFQAEYTDLVSDVDKFCTQSNILEFSAILKNRDLSAKFDACE